MRKVVFLTLCLFVPLNIAESLERSIEVDLERDPLAAIFQMSAKDIGIFVDGREIPDPRVEVFLEGIGGEELVERTFSKGEEAKKTKLVLRVGNARWGDVNIRTGPSMEFAVVSIVHNADLLTPIFQETNGWWHVELSDGKTGWISGFYVTKEAREEREVKEQGGLAQPVFFYPWRETHERPVLDYVLTISNSEEGIVRRIQKDPKELGKELPSRIPWDGTNEEGNVVALDASLQFQLEVHYPRGERALSPKHRLSFVDPGHVRLEISFKELTNPDFATNPDLSKRLADLVSTLERYPNERLVLEHFTIDGVYDAAGFTTEEIVQQLRKHPLLSNKSHIVFFAKTYGEKDAYNPVQMASLDPQSRYRAGSGILYLTSLKVDALLFDPGRIKNYTISVDRTAIEVATTEQEWYNIVFDPAQKVSNVRVTKFPFEELAPRELPKEKKEEEVVWRRARDKGFALDIGAHWVRTYAVTRNTSNSDTTGIGKLYSHFGLTRWGFPYLGAVLEKDLGIEAEWRNNILDKKTDVKGTAAPTQVIYPNINFFESNLMYRWGFGQFYDSPQILFKLGFHLFDFDVNTNPLVIVDHRLYGPIAHVGTLLPLRMILDDLSFTFEVGYSPLVFYREEGRTKEAKKEQFAQIFTIESYLVYHPFDFLSFKAGSWANVYHVDFTKGSIVEAYISYGGGHAVLHF